MNPPTEPFHPLRGLLQRARLALLQTDNRNRLINTPRHARRSKSVSLIDDSADDIFRLLVHDKRKLAFRPMPGATEDASPDEEPDSEPIPAPHIQPVRDGGLQTRLNAENLQRRLLGLQRDAKALEDEQGINVLYLTMGFLKWFENPSSDIAHEAPLVPVSLERDNARSTMRMVLRDADLETNLSLQEKLKQDFGIFLPDIPEIEDWTPASYFA